MKPRARNLGVPFRGTPGKLNAITDVAGVEVGHATIVRGSGKLVVGKGPVRTGVTAILPRGKKFDPVFAAWEPFNGNGEMTGTAWLDESGFLETPVLLTNTFSAGTVRDCAIAWLAERGFKSNLIGDLWYAYPLVSETYDGQLNDIVGQHVTRKDVFAALDGAKRGAVTEGGVGGGTGMISHGFKGGIGTSSRVTDDGYTVGALVQANHGTRKLFTVAGVPVGAEITDLMPEVHVEKGDDETGSIVVVIATDAPLLPHQLKRLCRRAPLGIGLVGGRGGNESGDLALAFSTANPGAFSRTKVTKPAMLPNDEITPLFEAVADATEEAIVNALVAAETMTGINGNRAYAMPHERLRAVLERHSRLVEVRPKR
jgi:L-aminopeptidase/D-esterase-like protein